MKDMNVVAPEGEYKKPKPRPFETADRATDVSSPSRMPVVTPESLEYERFKAKARYAPAKNKNLSERIM